MDFLYFCFVVSIDVYLWIVCSDGIIMFVFVVFVLSDECMIDVCFWFRGIYVLEVIDIDG